MTESCDLARSQQKCGHKDLSAMAPLTVSLIIFEFRTIFIAFSGCDCSPC